jgi:hypothetical protein
MKNDYDFADKILDFFTAIALIILGWPVTYQITTAIINP